MGYGKVGTLAATVMITMVPTVLMVAVTVKVVTTVEVMKTVIVVDTIVKEGKLWIGRYLSWINFQKHIFSVGLQLIL